ncbi:MAG TPA: MerR family transcriptional regulator [Dehalococcoidia bacterium]|nr:MerR family transcriptional regulator [Dehalococcoidia bacterium]
MEGITIGELARTSQVPPRTIRFYESKGLLPRPRRSPSGYRLYDQDDRKRLVLVRQARSLGFSLSEIKGLLRLAEHESCDSFQGRAAQSMLRKLDEVNLTIERLQRVRQELEESIKVLSQSCEGDCQQAVFDCECNCLGV